MYPALKQSAAAMPFCMKCGTQLVDDAAFCMKCGNPVPKVSAASGAPAAAAQEEGQPDASTVPIGGPAVGSGASGATLPSPSAPVKTPPATLQPGPKPSLSAADGERLRAAMAAKPQASAAPQSQPQAQYVGADVASSGSGSFSSQAGQYYQPNLKSPSQQQQQQQPTPQGLQYPQPISTNYNPNANPSAGSAAVSPTAAGSGGGAVKFGGQPRSALDAKQQAVVDAKLPSVIDGLKKLYKSKIRPLEAMYKFEEFASPALTDTDFDAKPMVLLLGQYSTGKTTFIRYLLERDFPGARIGPEPTTDRFMAIMGAPTEGIIPGNALAIQADKPFTALQKYGMAFLNKFECSHCPAPILDKISFVDTPGVLSGEKQRIGRSYNFPEVIEWFAERADRILLLFDAHKLDISDEFKRAIEALKGHDDKIRVVLNKADMVDSQQLMRVYGALMWSLGKVVQTPEVLRVYISSFWDQPLKQTDSKALLERERDDLLADLRSLPRNSTVRKVNELVKRARMARVHAFIVSYLRDQFGWFGKDSTKKKLMDGLLDEFKKIQHKYNLPMGDFPNLIRFREALSKYDIHKFPKLDPKLIANMDAVLASDIPTLTAALPASDQKDIEQFKPGSVLNPFDLKDKPSEPWMIDGATKNKYDNIFHALTLTPDQKVSGGNCKKLLTDSGLDVATLRHLWNLADVDKDGHLDSDEFAVIIYLIDALKQKHIDALPPELPAALIPPSKRQLYSA